jgi:hypothetical protein
MTLNTHYRRSIFMLNWERLGQCASNIRLVTEALDNGLALAVDAGERCEE